MQEKLNFVLLSIWSHIPIDLSVWASNIVYQREIWSLPTGAVDTIFHGQSRITGKIARKNDKNKSISLKLKYFLIAGAHNLKLVCSATYCNMTTNTPCFSRFPIDLTWQPVSAWHHASFWNRKRRWRHRSVRIVNWQPSTITLMPHSIFISVPRLLHTSRGKIYIICYDKVLHNLLSRVVRQLWMFWHLMTRLNMSYILTTTLLTTIIQQAHTRLSWSQIMFYYQELQ